MRILLLSHRYPPGHTAGAELYAARLAGELSRREHRVHVLTAEKDVGRPDLSLAEREHDGVPVTELVNNLYHERLRETWERPEVDRLFEGLLERWRPDLVHVQHLLYLSIGCVELARRRGIPVVFTLHDFWLQCPRFGQRLHPDGTICERIDFARCGDCLTSFKHAQSPLQRATGRALAALRGATGLDLGGVARGAGRLLQRGGGAHAEPDPALVAELAREAAARDEAMRSRLVPAVDLFLAPSRFLLERFVEWGLPRERIRHVDNGLEPLPRVARERSGERRLQVTFLGTLARHKGAHVLVEAWSRVPAALRGCGRLDLFGPPGGDPAYVAGLEQAARAAGAGLHGRLGREEVARVLAGTDLLVVPSLWWENQPLVILEALAAGTPVAVADLGGMPELVREGVDGFTFPAGDADALAQRLAELLGAPAALDALGRGAPSVPGVAAAVDLVEAAYADVLAARGESP